MDEQAFPLKPTIAVQCVTRLKGGELQDLCDASEAAVKDGGGFGWIRVPPREVLERYWHGVLAQPSRSLFVGRLDNVIAGSSQLLRPPPNAEAQSNIANFTTFFVAPWARGHGLAKKLVLAAEQRAVDEGFEVIQLDVRETQRAAIKVYRQLDYQCWGSNPHYAKVAGRFVTGHFYSKVLRSDAAAAVREPEAKA